MSIDATARIGGKLMIVVTSGAANRAARSACRTAQPLGIASANTKMMTTSKTIATQRPSVPNRCDAS